MTTFVVVGVAVLGSAALAASAPRLTTGTAVCPTRAFTVAFDPSRQVVVAAGERLASATFTTRTISRRCRRVAAPQSYVSRGLGPAIHERAGFRCAATKPIRIHVHPIRNSDGRVVGSVLLVGIGAPRFRVIVSVVLKNKGGPRASRMYRAGAYCKLGA